ncbi:hypothetical protein [Bacillus sp. FJAT-27251]|uniref:TolB family protein n=1 Tax=Bacillus sp. FJAT-27251 TaxID=1684142 RepID=UPI0006A7BA41|nr:hypothetical protein [Bacillus sp. FJAT-27251]
MKRILTLTLLLAILLPLSPSSASAANIQAAFIREGNLWVLKNGEETQITRSGTILGTPKWSPGGNMLAYQLSVAIEPATDEKQQSEVWIYNAKSGENKKIFHDGYSPKWAPNRNELAFNARGILNISNLKQFYNIAAGVSDYTWLPDGSGFLLSAAGTLRPDGWSSAALFTKKVAKPYEKIELFGGVEPFFTLPREVGTTAKNKLIAVNAEHFNYSPSGRWISFIVSPTASWSMDSNMLCVIDHEGNNFEVLDEIVFEVGEPKWAPSADTVAFIAGGGRIVFGFKNKDLKVRDMPVSGSLTPADYADLDFSWITNTSLVAERIKEQEWTNDFSKHPLPALYFIDLAENKQRKITSPPPGFGDYAPQFINGINKIVWLRGTSITDRNRTLWKANPDGSRAAEWVKNVEQVVFYQ